MNRPDVRRPTDRRSHPLRHLIRWQLIIGIVAVLLAAPLGGAAAQSAAIGATICVLGNLVAGFFIFRRYNAQRPTDMLRRIYAAEAAKIGLMLGLFILAFRAPVGLSWPIVLGGFIAVQILPALIPDHSGSAST